LFVELVGSPIHKKLGEQYVPPVTTENKGVSKERKSFNTKEQNVSFVVIVRASV
jgi:hypothetical protein